MESLPIEVLLVRPLLVQPMRLDVFAQERGSVTNAMQGETYPFFSIDTIQEIYYIIVVAS